METVTRSAYEEERGKPMPSKLHSIAQTNLIVTLSGYRPKYQVLSELTLRLGDLDVTPDLVVYRDLSVDFSVDEVRVTEPPLTAVEIASPTQGMQDLLDKIRDLLEHGVQSCWLVLPPLKTITVFTAGMESTTYSSGTITDPVTDIAVEWEAVFATPGSTSEA
ncbi:Uma2 family endonuclease [Salisaeta longa]|uniref:Uma2 family endonuclease n=1 Tax=Salisaeta longa TaxID=503170 RepID=UPI0003B5674F|nr:Uma2 family endonuclease [Salisaeta longa]